MDIHQTSVQFVAPADRLLLRVSTRDGQLFQIWLTRRLMLRAWPHLRPIVANLPLAKVSRDATVTPEAREMLADSLRERALQGVDFSTPFAEQPRAQPLGDEPMLATELRLTPRPGRGLQLMLLDGRQRHLTLELNDTLAAALLRLFESALQQADWGVALEAPAPAPAAAPRVLN